MPLVILCISKEFTQSVNCLQKDQGGHCADTTRNPGRDFCPIITKEITTAVKWQWKLGVCLSCTCERTPNRPKKSQQGEKRKKKKKLHELTEAVEDSF